MSLTGDSLFFGDIHNHNALGYGLGSLERSIDIARTHLDFFAFTGHSSWHDMPRMEGGREANWERGFGKLKNAWAHVQDLTAAANLPDDFVSFLGFEWHSSSFGDQCLILPNDKHPLVYPDSIVKLRQYCLEQRGLMIPHHLAYKTGHRGVNWDAFTNECSPVVEIYSEHGNAEDDSGAYDYFNHSMGGRVSANTAVAGLKRGHKFGFVASSDNHRGFPGAYGEGLLGVWAQSLNRDDIMGAIKDRRTIALTGDRISCDYRANGRPMGSEFKSGGSVAIDYDIEAADEIDYVDVVVNGHVAERFLPCSPSPSTMFDSAICMRFEWGWGPWADIDLDRICDWSFDLDIHGGVLVGAVPCLRSGPFDEDRRHRFRHEKASNSLRIDSYTGRRGAYRQNPNHSVLLTCEGTAETEVVLSMRQPVALSKKTSLGDLIQSSDMVFTGPFPAEACLFHRPVVAESRRLAGSTQINLEPGHNFVYMRVRQKNEQYAWASPVFVHVS